MYLPGAQLREEAPLGGGPDWVGYDALADHFRSFEPFLEEAGVATREELAVDTLARSAGRLEVPLGVLTAALGTPLFLWLLARAGRA